MVITMLTADAQNNVADSEDCAEWAEGFGSTHPVLADDQGFTWDTMAGGYNYPFYMLVDRGMVVADLAEGEGEITEEDIADLL
jgi:hypothetical protein